MPQPRRHGLGPAASWLWPAVLSGVVAGLLLLVAPSVQLLVGVVGALLLGAAVALRERRLWSLCLTDPLTGLANRRGFLRSFDRQLARVQRTHGSMALVLIDCDDFKGINDHYGHAAGDWALQLLAETLRASVRSSDVVARWGGDEFVVLLRDADEADVRRVADRVRDVLAPPGLRQAGPAFTVSLGGVLRDATQVHALRLRSLLLAADGALSLAKQRGGAQLAWSAATPDAPGPFDFEQHTPPSPAG